MTKCQTPFPIPFQSIKQMKEKEYDVLIVGTGAGGSAVLWRLCENWQGSEKRIGVIESGDLLLHTHVYNIPGLHAAWENYYGQICYRIGRRLPQFPGAEQVFAVGGRTLFWGAITPRVHASELAAWPFSTQEMETYYQIAEEIMQIPKDSSALSLPLQTVFEQLHAKGFPAAMPMPRAISHGQTFSSICFLRKAWERKQFDLCVKTRALQLLMENGRPVGLKVGDHKRNVSVLKAKTIILAAGPLETPRLLLHSAIHGNAIGHYLTNHSFIRATGVTSSRGASDTMTVFLPQTENTPYQMQIYLGDGWVHVLGLGKVESAFANKLTLDEISVDEYGVPHVHIDFAYSPKDQEVIRQMQAAIQQVITALGASVIHMEVQMPGSDYHESGTCRMGIDPSQSATNPFGQIHGVPGLYAADNSVLPSTGAANPTLTTVALAIRIADHIANAGLQERM